jgi:hypothetical protein
VISEMSIVIHLWLSAQYALVDQYVPRFFSMLACYCA